MKATTDTQTETIEEQNIMLLWKVLQVAEGQREKRGLQFGQAVYEYRKKHAAPGRRTDLNLVLNETRSETFEEFCDRLGIVRSTAYRWIAKYEESIGTRLPKPNPDNRPNETTSYKVEAEPTAQATSMDVSPDENSSSAEDDLPPESEPTPTPVVSTEEKEQKHLCFLMKRLKSISIALKQVVDGKAKWSKHAEYAEVISLGVNIADFSQEAVTEMTTKAT
jgi:transposase-like protein